MGLTLNPVMMLALATAIGFYLHALARLRRRGVRISRWRQAAFYGGVALMAVALLSPVDGLSDELMSAHMAQHLLIADLAAPLLLTGLRWPLLMFFLPRPLLVPLARMRWLRRLFSFLTRPLVAVPLYVLTLYAWHLTFMFEGALRNDVLHALQHQSFIFISILVWWPALEPNHRRLHGDLWKAGHILAARLGGMFLGMAFIVMRTPAYDGYYGDSAEAYGLTPLGDQQTAGGLMLSLDSLVVIFALSFFFWKAAQEEDRANARSGREPPRATPEHLTEATTARRSQPYTAADGSSRAARSADER